MSKSLPPRTFRPHFGPVDRCLPSGIDLCEAVHRRLAALRFLRRACGSTTGAGGVTTLRARGGRGRTVRPWKRLGDRQRGMPGQCRSDGCTGAPAAKSDNES
jgi:hypothetical protein